MKKAHFLSGACSLMLGTGVAFAAPAMQLPQVGQDALTKGRQALEQNPELEAIPNQILVRFTTNDPALTGAAKTLVSGQFIRKLKGVDGLEHIEVAMPVDRAITMLEALPFVEYAEPDYVVRPVRSANDTYFYLQWGIHNTGQSIRGVSGTNDADIDGTEAWDTRTSASNIVVAVIDSGTQWDHPDLDSNIWNNSDEIPNNGIDDDGNGYVDDVRGWDFYSNDNNPDDGDGHGTHVAGTIGAEGDNGQGVAGVAWDVQIMPLRFLGPFGGSTSDAILAINYAVANGAHISNNSWGGGGYSTSLYNAIANAENNNHLFVAAAGNEWNNNDSTPHYPSNYNNDNVISVASIDNRGLISDHSAWGSNYGATSVDIGAPGSEIASTYPTNSYAWSSGTSMATPHVSGAAAIIWAQNPSWTYAQVRDSIFDSAVPNASLSGKCVTGGVLNLEAALDGAPPANTAPSANISSPGNGSTFTEGDSVFFSASASDSEDGNISSSITWTSSRDGSIGTGASFSTSSLSVGSHTITASVTDSGGLSDSDAINITVEADQPANTAPTASINSPSNGATFTEGDSVSFSGSASDNEDGNISSSLVWTSNLDGQIGTGASFSTSGLSVGNHTITASVSDSGGLSDSDSVNITIEADTPVVTPPATPGRPNVSSLGGGSVQITWADNSNNETSFEIRRQERVGRTWTNDTIIASVGADVTQYVDNPGSGRFRYRVRAVNSAGNSSWSSWRAIRIR